MKYQKKMELMLCEEFAAGVTNMHSQQLCVAAANSDTKGAVVVQPQQKPKLTSEEEELLFFLSSDSFSFDSMQARWK